MERFGSHTEERPRYRFTPESAVIALKEAGAEPLEPYPNSTSKKWKCRCLSCSEVIYPRMGSIVKGSKACRHCFGSLPVNEAVAYYRMLNAGVEPLERYPGYSIPWLVRCKTCGHESTPRYDSILKGQGGCFRCGREYSELPSLLQNEHCYEGYDDSFAVFLPFSLQRG
jgi:formylmethanofuran dehydrogenase subunit E